MGIKGLYDELGTPDRVPLSKLSIEHFRRHKRHIRVAIDIAIWSFQSQAVQGRNAGCNAPHRVLYYRLCTLLSLNVHAVFVFDGKERPDFKRNRKVSKNEGYQLALARRLIIAFGFPIHNAPGEAEAECAHLQKQGVVDAVLSEDVDTLMFGCRNLWRSGPDKGDSKSLETFQVYQSRIIREHTGLTPSGMILVALLSGGDYDSTGVAKIGMKQAVAAAKAGYGDRLLHACKVYGSDGGNALREWRTGFEQSLKTNHERIFTRRQPSSKIPEDFPDLTIVDYYVNPKVTDTIPAINWDIRPDLHALREITKSKFEWTGSGKLIRTMSEKLLSWQLGHNTPGSDALVLSIHQRASGLKGGMPNKLRITYTPLQVVPLPYSHDEDNVHVRSVSALDTDVLLEDANGFSDSDKEDIRVNGIATTELVAGKPDKPRTEYDPRINQRAWIYEDFLVCGAKNHVEVWNDSEAKKRALKEKQGHERTRRSNTRKQHTKKTAVSLTQRSISSYYTQQKKPAAEPPKPSDARPVIIDIDPIEKVYKHKENIPFPKSKNSIAERAPPAKPSQKTHIKVVPRESLPGAWKVLSTSDDKLDDNALANVSVYYLEDD